MRKLESEEEKLLTVLINGTHWTSRPAISETTSQSEYWPITIGSRSIGAFLIICLSIGKMEKCYSSDHSLLPNTVRAFARVPIDSCAAANSRIQVYS